MRLNYGYDNRYLFTFTARADGSSKFGAGNKWAYFPSGAVSWNATTKFPQGCQVAGRAQVPRLLRYLR
jgi:hypothetical protein